MLLKMKFTVFVKGSHTVVPLQNSILTSNYNSVFVKRVAVFWEYLNIRKQTTLMTVKTDDGSVIVDVDAGYYTLNDMKEKLGRSEVTLTYLRPNARTWIETSKHKVTIKRKLLEMLGLRRFGDQLVSVKCASTGGESRVDFNDGLKFVNIHCNLASKSYNVSHLGKPSDVITSVTVPTDRSLFGSVVSYIDVESKTSIVKGTCSELIFHVTDQDGKSIDIGEVLIEMYLE
jgi:hypothetical protein